MSLVIPTVHWSIFADQPFVAQWPESELVEKPVPNGPFLPFFFKPGPLTKATVPTALRLGTEFGANKANGLKDPNDPSKGKKRIIVEFSSPNVRGNLEPAAQSLFLLEYPVLLCRDLRSLTVCVDCQTFPCRSFAKHHYWWLPQ
jgi:hypothetical protein